MVILEGISFPLILLFISFRMYYARHFNYVSFPYFLLCGNKYVWHSLCLLFLLIVIIASFNDITLCPPAVKISGLCFHYKFFISLTGWLKFTLNAGLNTLMSVFAQPHSQSCHKCHAANCNYKIVKPTDVSMSCWESLNKRHERISSCQLQTGKLWVTAPHVSQAKEQGDVPEPYV